MKKTKGISVVPGTISNLGITGILDLSEMKVEKTARNFPNTFKKLKAKGSNTKLNGIFWKGIMVLTEHCRRCAGPATERKYTSQTPIEIRR